MGKKRARYSNPFQTQLPLQLSEDAVQELHEVARLSVLSTVRQYETYLRKDSSGGARSVDDALWKLEVQKENVRVFSERRRSSRSSSSSGSSHPVTGADIPTLMAVGTIDGSLDDAMYGSVSPTVDTMRIKTSYVDDNLVDAVVLATLVAPTPSDPFRTMSVKWVEKGQSLHVRALVKNRDLVFLESTGMTKLSTGERIGYLLVHSVHFPSTPPLEAFTRGNMSICALYRQFDATSVDVFIKAYLSPADGILRAAVVKSAVEVLASSWRYIHCARMKKLAWFVHQQRRLGSSSSGTTSTSSTSSSFASRASRLSSVECVTCKVPAASSSRSLLRSSSSSSLSSSSKTRTCSVCGHFTCSACQLKKKLSFVSLENARLLQQELAFCAICIHEVMIKADARLVASEELITNQDHQVFSSGISVLNFDAQSD